MSLVKDMDIGAEIMCSRHGGLVALNARMKRAQTRICDACTAAYKAKHGAATREEIRQKRNPAGQILDSLPWEEWRPIPGFDGYEASSLGRIRSLNRRDAIGRLAFGRVLRLRQNKQGYQVVRVRAAADDRSKNRFVHRLVALAFHGRRPIGLVVAHYDGNPGNNRIDNLRYATNSENEADKLRHGTKFVAAGEFNGHAKLTEVDVRNVLQRLANGEKQAACARDLGVHRSAISQIKCGTRWRHISGGSNV